MHRTHALIIALLSATGALFCPIAGAQEGSPIVGNHWQVEEQKLRLVDEHGAEKQAIKLERRAEADNPGLPVRETKAMVSTDERVALVIDHDWDTGKDGLLGSVRCFDSSGTLRWEEHGIDMDRIRLSDDGQTSLVVVRSEDGCSPVEDSSCTVSALVLDANGKELFKLGPFSNIGGYVLTKNGKFGWVGGVRSRSKVYEFFNVAKGTVTEKKMKDVAGGPSIGEDGVVKFVKKVYDYKAPPEPAGGAKVIRVDVVGELDLR